MKCIVCAMVFISSLILFSSCEKDKNANKSLFESEAIIAGYNMFTPDCEKGFVINIQNDSRYSRALFTDELPDPEIDPWTVYPVRVYMNWKVDTMSSCENKIIVTRMERAE